MERSSKEALEAKENPEEILGSDSFLLLLKICGVLPMKLSSKNFCFSRFNKFMFWGSWILCFVITTSLLVFIDIKIHEQLNKDKVRSSIREMKIVINQVSMFLLASWPVLYLKKIRNLLYEIATYLDNADLDYSTFHTKIYRYSMFCVFFSLIATATQITIRIVEYNTVMHVFTIRHFLTIVFDLVFLRMVLTVMLVVDLMLALAYLRLFWKPPNLEADTTEYLEAYMELNMKVDGFVSEFNEYTGLFFLIFCFNFLINIVYSIYDISIILSHEVSLAILEKAWEVVMFWLIPLVMVTYAGEKVEETYQNSTNALANASAVTSDKALRKKATMYLMKHSIIPGSISAWGFFNVNNELVVSMFGAIATYVIVLLEFKQAGPSGKHLE